MAKCTRPVWTTFFGFLWVSMFVAAIIMHVSLGDLVPSIQDFPENLLKGFMVVFHFEQLKTLAVRVKTDAEAGMALCDVTSNIASTCSAIQASPSTALSVAVCARNVDSSSQKNSIKGAFSDGLTTIQKVGNDKYLGTPDMASAADNLNDITTELDTNIGTSTACCVVAPAYCVIWEKADGLYNMYGSVKAEIDKFTTGDAIKSFNDIASYLKFLHILPWILILSTCFFGIMWLRNGACCCCSNGSVGHCLGLALPQALFWLLAFIIMMIFTVIGYGFQIFVTKEKIPHFKNDPTVEELLDHFQDTFPEFWDIVFKEMAEGMALFRIAASIFVIVSVLVSIYSCCFCCLRPYGKGDKAAEQEAKSGSV